AAARRSWIWKPLLVAQAMADDLTLNFKPRTNDERTNDNMKVLRPFLAPTLALVFSTMATLIAQPADQDGWAKITEDETGIHLETDTLTATFRKKGYVSGVAAQSFLDKRTGFRD